MIVRLVPKDAIIEGDEDAILTMAMRQARNDLLKGSDWAMISDATTDKQAWADYRQALRDFPSTWVAGPTADFPDPPVG